MAQLIEFASNHFILVASFFFVLTILVMNLLQEAGGTALLSQQAVRLLNQDDAIAIDIRTEAEYESGHIVNAIHVDATSVKKDTSELDRYKDQPLLVYCASGVASTAVVRKLRRAGFREVHSLKGGINGWRTDNLPLAQKT